MAVVRLQCRLPAEKAAHLQQSSSSEGFSVVLLYAPRLRPIADMVWQLVVVDPSSWSSQGYGSNRI